MKTIVVNLMGGAGAGKSTLASDVFVRLKKKGYNCELVSEYAKGVVYEENFRRLNNQLFIFGNQYYNMDMIRNKVDIVICDCPLVMSIFYNNYQEYKPFAVPEKLFRELVMYCYSTFDNLNYFIKRDHEYKCEGRYQDEARALKEEKIVYDLVEKLEIDFSYLLSSQNCAERIVEDVEKRYQYFESMKKAGVEIERKFLLDVLPEGLNFSKTEYILQGYLNNNGQETRVRNIANKRFILTEKYGSGILRDEYEKDIDKDEYLQLLKLAGDRVIKKLRSYLPLSDGHTAEIDIYQNKFNKTGQRLMTVEVEFSSLDEANKFKVPSWFGKEVTGVKEYKNSALAQKTA